MCIRAYARLNVKLIVNNSLNNFGLYQVTLDSQFTKRSL